MAVPKLRFKEFDGDLTESKLVELTLWASGGTPAKDIPEYWGDDIPLISGASMHTNQLYESDVKITRLGLQKGSKLAPKDSILILVRGSMLFNKIPMGITLGDVAFNQDVKCIRPKQELAPQFLFQWLHAKENTIQNKVTATGIGAGKLDTADLQNLKLYKPSSEEQTKIASFLSNVDEKISQLTQKHELLNQYKQGMMQKLFSQQIRFKGDDSGEFGEWETKCLGDTVTTMQSGLSRQLHDEDIGLVVLRSNNVIDNKVSFDDVKFWYLNDPQGADVNNYLLDDGDILVNFINSMAQIGKSAIYRKTLDRKVICTTNILRIKADQTKVTSEFLNFIFQTNVYQNYIQSITKPAVNQASFTTKEFKMMIFKIPCLEEQTKIANFLSSIDQKIEVVAQQIEQAKQWKKGLLQQMFV